MFNSYQVQDIVTILKARLGMVAERPSYSVFEEDAIKVRPYFELHKHFCFRTKIADILVLKKIFFLAVCCPQDM